MLHHLRRVAALFGIVCALALVGALVFGTVAPPPPLASISEPFRGVDFSDAPAPERLEVAGASPIAWRRYGPAEAKNAVIALHGSTASSISLHPLARGLAERGVAVYAPDIRGHGETGRRGDLDHAGQTEEDLAAMVRLVRARHPAARLTLAGFSLGGGLALRYAGGPQGGTVDRTLLLAPMLGPRAPTAREGEDPWARPHLPRIIALSILNRVGFTALDGLESIVYATRPGSETVQTSRYSWRLLRSLLPGDYAALLAGAASPVHVLIGEKDELFRAERFEATVKAARPDATVTVVPGLGHIALTLDPAGIEAIAAALR